MFARAGTRAYRTCTRAAGTGYNYTPRFSQTTTAPPPVQTNFSNIPPIANSNSSTIIGRIPLVK